MTADPAPLQLGVQLPEIEWRPSWSEVEQMAITAEAVGFDSLWLGDHLVYDTPDGPSGPWECWTLLSAVAAVTERVLLGPLVSPTAFRNPALLAKMAATVDEVAAGRLVLGLGAGWNRFEFDAFDIPFEPRVARFAEAFAIITGLIRSGRVEHRGEYHRADGTVLVPPARPQMPIMIGSSGPRMLEITAPHLDWWNEWWAAFSNRPEELPPLLDRLDAALRAAGRDPAEIVRSVAVLVQVEGGSGRRMGNEAAVQPITGTLAQIADRLLQFSPLVDHVQLVVDPITIESIESLASVVDRVRAG